MLRRMPASQHCSWRVCGLMPRILPAPRTHLEWAMKNATEVAVQHSARLRLGRLLLDQGETAAVLTLVNIKDTNGFVSEYEELKADALLAQGDRDGARHAYQTAIEKHRALRRTCRRLPKAR